MKTFKTFLTDLSTTEPQDLPEALSSIEIASNARHMANPGPRQAGPDPAVQKELRNQGVLYRAAKASQSPLIKVKLKLRSQLSGKKPTNS